MSISSISEKVRYLLWAKAAGRCQFNGCNKLLFRDGLTQIEMNFADVAHIIGDRPGGPRGDDKLSEEYCNDVSNLMLLCLNHHRMIDQIYENYSEQQLRQMKAVHETRMVQLTSILPDRTSNVVLYTCRIGSQTPRIEPKEAWLAMANDWYPAVALPIELGGSKTEIMDDEDRYWITEEEVLSRQFYRKLGPIIEATCERCHFSIFGIAPQPLLIKLGTLFSDIHPAEVYQLHREPQTWSWQNHADDLNFSIIEPETNEKNVALILSLSASITTDRVEESSIANPFSIWRLEVAEPSNDIMQSREQLGQFRKTFRRLLDRIKAHHGQNASLHLFPAVPNSVAIEIGRVWQPKADLPMTIFDQNRNRDGFIETITIGSSK